jgi:hypothetical protein
VDVKPPAPRLKPIDRYVFAFVSFWFVSRSRLRVSLNVARYVTSVLGIKRWLCSDHSRSVSVCVAVVFSTACIAHLDGQANPPPLAPDPPTKHIFGIFPNYGTSPSLSPHVSISTKEKFKIASEDALDPGGIVVAAAAGGVAQLLNSNRVFGQEVSGYGRYFAAAYGNHVIGDFMTEGVYPSLLHQDPRYFRKSTGSAGSRLGYAISRVFWTQTDAGGTAFNYSRVLGTTSTIAISSLYYAHHRDASISADALGIQLGAAMAANILKEFWPDLLRKISRKH